MAVVEKAATDSATATEPLTFEPLVTDTAGALDRFTANDGLITTTQAITMSDHFSVTRSSTTGGTYTMGTPPYDAVVLSLHHTWATVLFPEDLLTILGNP